jgi:argininosuccinate lyase
VALLANVDRLAEDLQIWATTEFNFIELADRHSRISVIMPHKKNPYSLAFVRGVAREMVGRLAGAAVHQLTPSGQVDNRIFEYGGVPHSLEQTTQAARLLAETVASFTVNADVMAQRVEQGFGSATDLAESIMLTARLDAHTAHRIVGQAVRVAHQSNQSLSANLLNEAAINIFGQSLNLTEAQIAEVINPQAIVNTRAGPGGAAPQSVRAMLDTFQAAVTDAATWCSHTEKQLATATTQLLETAQKLADLK